MNLGNVERAQIEPTGDNQLKIELFDEYDVLQYRIITYTYNTVIVDEESVEITESIDFTNCTFRINRKVPQIEITTV